MIARVMTRSLARKPFQPPSSGNGVSSSHSQPPTERIVRIVLATAICLILVSAVIEVPIKLVLP
jgi:hypothetical protein